jgi:hypothetical protein
MFWIGLFTGFTLGVIALGIFRYSRNNDAECADCKAYYTSIIRERDAVIHGLKSTKGALAKEVQHLSFMNSGYRAR